MLAAPSRRPAGRALLKRARDAFCIQASFCGARPTGRWRACRARVLATGASGSGRARLWPRRSPGSATVATAQGSGHHWQRATA